ncbi:hypothetical protein ACUOA8_54790, partial [Escherichia sp. SS-MK2]
MGHSFFSLSSSSGTGLLAVEECIFRQMPATQRVLFLWRNADT